MSVGMAAPRALYGCDPDSSRGRLFAEPPSKTRSPFRRDCDRVIHSTAFRRLKQGNVVCLDVAPQRLALALVNQYLDVKRRGQL